MDPLALSGAFATLVGLLANFKAERSGAALSDFMDWLKDQHQDQIVARIAADRKLTQELEVVLAIKHEDLILKLGSLTEQVSAVASRIDGFAGLASHFTPSSVLSDQAHSILGQLVKSQADYAQECEMDDRTLYLFVGGAGGELAITEPMFLNEDIHALQLAGLLRGEHTPNGANKLVPSRLGYEYIQRRDA